MRVDGLEALETSRGELGGVLREGRDELGDGMRGRVNWGDSEEGLWGRSTVR